TNDLYKEYGVGRVQKVRGEHAKVEFNPSVFMTPPYRSENKILPLAKLEKVDTPLDRAARGQWDAAWRFELKMLAARLLTGNKGGQLSNARTEILPHQIFTAHRVVSSPRRRFLLADEVGLGTPAGLTTQWQEEMKDKFGADFEIFGRDFTSYNPRVWEYRAQSIASLDRLKRKENKRLLLEMVTTHQGGHSQQPVRHATALSAPSLVHAKTASGPPQLQGHLTRRQSQHTIRPWLTTRSQVPFGRDVRDT
ncbi:MAG: hypothetical protein L0Y71_08280, partial [Gemmataceae bacterium]|nr:hypothetical protein [Gemmataceae bacterium]